MGPWRFSNYFQKRTSENFILLKWKLLLEPGPESEVLTGLTGWEHILHPFPFPAGLLLLENRRGPAPPRPPTSVVCLPLFGLGGEWWGSETRGTSYYGIDRCSVLASMLGDFLLPSSASDDCSGDDDTTPHFQCKWLFSRSSHAPRPPPAPYPLVIIRIQAFGRTDVTLREAMGRRESFMSNPA